MIFQPKYAGDHQYSYYKVVSQQALTVSSSVVGPTIPQGCRIAKAYFRGGRVRVMFDGSNPASGSTGITFDDGYEEFFSGMELANMKLIRETEDATVHFVYYQ